MRTEKSFTCLYRCLLAIFALEIFAGLLIAIICEYVKLFVQSHFFQIDAHQVLSVIFVIKLYGLHVSICFSCGIVVISLFSDVYTRHMGFLIKLWIFLIVESSIGSLFTTWLFVDTMNYVSKNLEASLTSGIKLYTKDPMWMLIWDDLQYDYKCCGIHNHTDWMKISINKNDFKSAKDVGSSWLPFSCARGIYQGKISLSDESIHLKGCFFVISEIIDTVKSIMVSINVFIAIFMVKF